MNEKSRRRAAAKYYTVRHHEEFQVDWKDFYRQADERSSTTVRAFPHYLDIAYGKDPKQRLDIILPQEKPSLLPVFMFLHGGGFREGDRCHYTFVAEPLARQGIITVLPSYRLTPRFHYPDQVKDVQQSLTWVFRHGEAYGIDPQRVFLGGHSAGGVLAAFVGLQSAWLRRQGLPEDLIKGCVPMSAPYDLREEDWISEYIPDPARRAEASPILHIERLPPITIVSVGSVLRPEAGMVQASRDLVGAIREKGGRVEFIFLEGMNHGETALALGETGNPLVQAILRMIVER